MSCFCSSPSSYPFCYYDVKWFVVDCKLHLNWGDAGTTSIFQLCVSFSLQTSCFSLNEYLQGPLGRYLLNVSTAAELCSQRLCGSQGRCLRRHPDTDAYLHLSPLTHSIVSLENGKFNVQTLGQLGEEDIMGFQREFQCQCYSGYQGEGCGQRDPLQQRGIAPSVMGTWVHCLLLLLLTLLL